MRVSIAKLNNFIDCTGGPYRIDRNSYSTKFSYGKSFKYRLIRINLYGGADVLINESNTLTDLIKEVHFFAKFHKKEDSKDCQNQQLNLH